MSGMSTYLAGQLLGWIKSTAFATDPAAVYVALYSSDPTDSGTGGTDVTTTINAAGRVAVTFGTIASKGMANDAAVDFGNADAGASVTHFGVWDASTSGNMLWSDALTTPRTILTGDPAAFAIGDLTASFA